MNKKKILFFTRPIVPPWDEASKNLAFDIAINLDKSNLEVQVLTPRKSKFNQELTRKYPYIKPEQIYQKSDLDLSGKIKLIKRLFRLKLNTDLIHFLFTPRPLTSTLFRTRLKLSKIKTIQTVATISKKNLANSKKLKKILFANIVVVQSKNTLNKLKKAGIDKALLIYPGINLKKYRPGKKDPDLLKKFKIDKKDFVVLYTGEYTRLKAIDDILKSIQLIFKKNPQNNLKFILACRIKSKADQKKKNQIIKVLEKEKLTKKVIFLDTFSEMEKLYNLSDINIFPAQEMAGKFDIPLTLVESMACKKPIIVSRLTNLKELVGKNTRGLVCKIKDPEDLAEKINLLKNDKKLYNEIARRAQDFVEENFDIKKNIKKYENIYKELLN